MERLLNSQGAVVESHDHRVIWLAVVASVFSHILLLIWWPSNRPAAERVFSAMREFNVEVVNLAPLPEPDNFLRPTFPEPAPNIELEATSDKPITESVEEVVLPEIVTSSDRVLRFDALSIKDAVSSVELSSNPDADRTIPANEHQLSGRIIAGSDQFYVNSQGQNVVIVDGQCFIIEAKADDISHGKQVAMQIGGGGCPYVKTRSEKLVKAVMERVCSRFRCD